MPDPQIFSRTTRQLVDELIDKMIENPSLADQPIGFTTGPLDSPLPVYFVREIDEHENSIVLGRGL